MPGLEGEVHLVQHRLAGHRRAVVFYLDKGEGFLTYLTWWLHAWRTIGLDSKDEVEEVEVEVVEVEAELKVQVDPDCLPQEFDIILLTHPTSIPLLPNICQPVPQDFNPLAVSGPGRSAGVTRIRHLATGYENTPSSGRI